MPGKDGTGPFGTGAGRRHGCRRTIPVMQNPGFAVVPEPAAPVQDKTPQVNQEMAALQEQMKILTEQVEQLKVQLKSSEK